MKMKSVTQQLAVLTVALAAGSGAQAALTYGDIGGPGVYVGNGVTDGEFTINTDNNIQTALRVKNRQTFALIDGSDGTYNTGQGSFGSGTGAREIWNYEFSVNLRAAGANSSALDFSNLTVTMRVDIDPTSAVQYVDLNVLTGNWGDNEWWNGAERTGTGPMIGDWGVQQSVNPLFPNSGFGYSPGPGTYNLQLVVGLGTTVLSSVTTAVQVPEPSGLALTAVALAGLGFAARRRRQA